MTHLLAFLLALAHWFLVGAPPHYGYFLAAALFLIEYLLPRTARVAARSVLELAFNVLRAVPAVGAVFSRLGTPLPAAAAEEQAAADALVDAAKKIAAGGLKVLVIALLFAGVAGAARADGPEGRAATVEKPRVVIPLVDEAPPVAEPAPADNGPAEAAHAQPDAAQQALALKPGDGIEKAKRVLSATDATIHSVMQTLGVTMPTLPAHFAETTAGKVLIYTLAGAAIASSAAMTGLAIYEASR